MNIQFRHRLLSMMMVLIMLFTMNPVSVIAEEEHDHSHEEAVTVLEVADLSVSASASKSHVYVGDGAVTVTAKISGGLAPYEVTLQAVKNGDVVATDAVTTSDASAKLSFAPQSYGDYELVVVVHDAQHTQELVSVSLTAAEHDEETEADWAASVSGASVGSNWASSLVSVAKTQVGYKESEKDFTVKSGAKQGYSRYGAWYGTPYGGWNNAFLAFVAEYANIPDDAFLSGSSYRSWVNGMSAKNAYEKAGSDYTPKAGDIAFLSGSRVAIIESVSGSNINVIEGDVDGAVVRKSYALSKVAGIGNTCLLMGLYNGTATAVPVVTAEPTQAPEGSVTATPAPTAAPTATPVPADDEELTFQATATPGPGMTVAPKDDGNVLGSLVSQMGETVEKMQAAATSVPTQFSEAYYLMKAEMEKLVEKYLGTTTPTEAEVKAFVEGLGLQELYYVSMEFDELAEYAANINLAEKEAAALFETESMFALNQEIAVRMAQLAGSRTQVEVANGVIAITDTLNNIKNSNGTVTAVAIGSRALDFVTNTITITNATTVGGSLQFTYKVTGVGTGDGAQYGTTSLSNNATATVTERLEKDGTLTFKIWGNNNGPTLTLSGFIFTADAIEETEITLAYDSSLGSVTVGENIVADGSTVTISGGGAALFAAPNAGSTFLGWTDDTGLILSTSASYTLLTETDMTVKAVFAKDGGDPWFGVGGTTSHSSGMLLNRFNYYTVGVQYLFDSLNTAVTFANSDSANKVVVLMNSGTLPAGTHNIPSGVTLLIPFDAANTMYIKRAMSSADATTPTAYRTLTFADGAHLTVDGRISISGNVHYATANTRGSAPAGKVGYIALPSANSSITMNSGSELHAFGYITGNGSVVAKNGSSVYECFQFMDFRGGTVTDKMADDTTHGVFPITQYYVLNVEAPMTLEAGAKEYSYATIYMGSQNCGSSVNFIGPSNAMFILSSGSVLKKRDGDRMVVELNGKMEVATLSVSISYVSMNTANFELPVHGKITINVNSGSELTLGQDIAVYPDAVLNIKEGAKCILGKDVNIYLYDLDQWGNYCSSVNVTGKTIDGEVYAPTQDAKIIVNGTVDASAGHVYTTTAGADICSEGAGSVKVVAGEETITYQVTQIPDSYTPVEIPINPAWLKNADGSYTATNAAPEGVTYYYTTDGGATYLELKSYDGTYKYIDGVWVLACDETRHICVKVGDFPATCTEAYKTVYKCQCKAELLPVYAIADSLQALGHTYERTYAEGETDPTERQVVARTCTVDGYITYTCGDSTCTEETEGHTKTVRPSDYETEEDMPAEIMALVHPGHSSGDPVTENSKSATCTADGSYDTVVYCSVCETEISRETVTVKALGHKYGEGVVTTEPDCENEGVMTYTCNVCKDGTEGKIKTDKPSNYASDDAMPEEIKALKATGHTEETVPGRAPTCTVTGLTDGTKCEVCGSILTEQTSISANGHTYLNNNVETEPASCTAPGYILFTCEECNKEDGYQFKVTEDMTFEDLDSNIQTWLKNNGITTLEALEQQPHSYGTPVLTERTCLEDGYLTLTCTKCGVKNEATEENEGIVIIRHNTIVTDLNQQARRAYEDYLSINTGFILGDLQHIGHQEVVDEAVAATCIATGKTEGKHCSACGTVMEAQETIDVLPHNYTVVKATERTCTVDGTLKASCDQGCKYDQTFTPAEFNAEGGVADMPDDVKDLVTEALLNQVTALGHTAGNPVTENEVAATCTTAGSYDTVEYCSVCSTEEKPVEISRVTTTVDPLGHAYTQQGEAKPKTCTEHGEITFVCANADCDAATVTVTFPDDGDCEMLFNSLDEDIREALVNADAIEALEKTDHDYVRTENGTPVSCGVTGVIVYVCQNDAACEEIRVTYIDDSTNYDTLFESYHATIKEDLRSADTIRNLKAWVHDYSNTTYAPTCEAAGYIEYICSKCKNTFTEEYADQLSHNYVVTATPSNSCTENGTISVSCERGCNFKQTDIDPDDFETVSAEWPEEAKQAVIASGKLETATGDHVFKQVDAEFALPTCTETGKFVFECDNPNNSNCSERVIVTYHENGEAYYNTLHPSIQEALKWESVASEDEATKENALANIASLKPWGHKIDVDDFVRVEATCEKEGTIVYHCDGTQCDYTYTLAPSTYDAEKVPTELQSVITDDLRKSLAQKDHNYEIAVTLTPTCTAQGKLTVSCDQGCGYTATFTPDEFAAGVAGMPDAVVTKVNERGFADVAAMGHDFNMTSSQDATCNTEGYIVYTCQNDATHTYTLKPSTYQQDLASGLIYEELKETAAQAVTGLAQKLHVYNLDNSQTVAATCTESGKLVYKCVNDGCAVSVTVEYSEDGYAALDAGIQELLSKAAYDDLRPTDHNYDWIDSETGEKGIVTTPATCLAEGYITKTCNQCKSGEGHQVVVHYDATSTEPEILALAKLDHNYKAEGNVVIVTATCASEGSMTFTCTNGCNTSYEIKPSTYENLPDVAKELVTEAELRTLDKRAHNYTSVTTTPTCEEAGYIIKTCIVCDVTAEGHQVRVDYDPASTEPEIKALAPKGHDYACVYTAPTCEGDGEFVFTCENTNGEGTCGEQVRITKGTEIGILEELLKNAQIAEAVTAKFPESFVPATDLDPLGHQWNDGVVTNVPTCTEKGEKTFTCIRPTADATCGKTRTEDVDPTGHNYIEDASQAVTSSCTESGKRVFKCNNGTCTDNVTVTYSEDGYANLHSTIQLVMDEESYKLLKPTGHQSTREVAQQNPTCQEVGYTKGVYCDDCKTWISGHSEISKVDHAYPDKDVNASYYTAPTCVDDGYWTLACIYNCGLATKTEMNLGSAINHAGKVYHERQDATCTEDGYTAGYFCEACETRTGNGWIEGHEVIKAEGHKFTRTEQQRTCEEDGSITFDCDNCDLAYVITPDNFDEMKAAPDVDQQVKTALEGVNISDYAHIGHVWTIGTQDAACEKEGSITFDCDNCDVNYIIKPSNCETINLPDDVRTELNKYTIADYKAREHNWTAWADDPNATATCTEDGKEIRTCQYADCLKSESRDKDALGHTYKDGDNWVEERCTTFVKPTCTDAGYKVYTCDREGCTENTEGHVSEQVPVAELGHDWKGAQRTEPTCVKDGESIGNVCDRCGAKTDHEVLPKLGHNYKDGDNWVEEHCTTFVEPTCTEDGYKVYTCTREGCTEDTAGHMSEQVPVAALGHDWSFVRTEPKCDVDGKIVYTCSRTDCVVKIYTLMPDTYEAEAVPTGIEVTPELINGLKKTNHPKQYEVAAVAPNCTEVGYTKGVYCPECEKYIDGGHQAIEANGHTWTSVTTKPTCTAPGYITYSCTVDGCDGTYTVEHDIDLSNADLPKNLTVTPEEVTALAQHVPASRMVAETCYANAYTEEYCSVEGEGKCTYYKKTEIPGTQRTHLTTVFVETIAPDCDKETNGYDVYRCEHEGCGFTENKNTTPWNHTYGDEFCTVDQTCTVCGEVLNPAPGHNYEQTGTVDKTCTTDGKIIFTCKGEHCGTDTKVVTVTYSENYAEIYEGLDEDIKALLVNAEAIANLKATDHDWDEGKVTTEPTCTEAGVKTYTCKNDASHTKTESVAATGHAYTLTNEQEATCLENGVLTYTCGNALCGEITEVVTVTYSENYAEIYEGLDEDIKALLVNAEAIANLKATDHDWDEGEVTTEPTCTEAGVKTYTCKNDAGHTKTESVAATGHAYKQTETTTKTCLEHGTITFTCQNDKCGSETKSVTVTYSEDYQNVYKALDKSIQNALKNALVLKNLKATGHSYTETVTQATCTTKGYTTFECKNCDYSYIDKYTDVIAHTYTSEVLNASTCKENGTIKYTCTECGHSYKDTLPLDPVHKYVTMADVNPTCTESGTKGGQQCSVCGKISDSNQPEIVPATGHTYGYTYTAPTCEGEGVYIFVCQNGNCGDQQKITVATAVEELAELLKKEEIAAAVKENSGENFVPAEDLKALGHDIVIDKAQAPTCTEDGLKEGQHCSRCDAKTVNQEIDPALGHKFSAEENGKDCIEGRICERCNQEVAATAEHKWNAGVITTAPTCTEEGVKTFTCDVCSDTYTEKVDKIPHNYESAVTEPTCEADGFTTYTCSECGDTYIGDTVKTTGHAWGEPVLTPNTCGKDGFTTKTCSACGEVETYDKTTATGNHTYGDWVETKAPTCTTEGEKQQTCEVCGNVATDTVEVKEHLNDITIDAIAPECGKVGWTEGKKCSACGQTTVVPEVVKALLHNWVAFDYKAPTCTEDGNANNGSYCTLCGAVDAAATVLPATNHKNKAPGEAKDPTCTEAGNTAGLYCPDCETWLEEQEVLAATEHANKAPGEAKDPTCTEAGITAGMYCPDCEVWLEEQETIEALGHNMDEGVEDPKHTCTTAGVMKYTCLNGCGYTETEEVFAAHTPEVIHAVPHTCTEDGLTEGSKCAVCGEILVAQEVDPAAHEWETVTLHKDATCTEDGSRDVRCVMCGATDTIVIPAKGHTEVIDPAVAATCHADGSLVDGLTEGKHCSVCEEVLVAQVVVKADHSWSVAPCSNENAICISCGYTNGTELKPHNMAAATCTKPATCVYTGCGHTEGEALGHTLIDIDEIPVTCEASGWTAGVQCTVCGVYTVTPKEIKAFNHKLNDGITSAIVQYEAKNPTFTTPGWEAYEACSRCNYSTYVEIPALGEQSIDTYSEMLQYLPYLEQWADEYAKKTPGTDPVSLVIKYIRTGVERYNSGSWGIMAGYEDKGFAEFVAQKEDEYNSVYTAEQFDQMIQVTGLKNLKEFTLPNDPGFYVDFGHMFGTMDITYTNKGSQNHADVGGWAGDLVDLLSTSDHDSHQDVIESAGDDFEALVTVIRTKLLGYDFDHEDTFALNDYYGDLDAFYIMETLDTENYAAGDMTKLFQNYFTVALDDVARADFLLVNRFDDVRTRSAIREAVYTEYTTNAMISTLEGTREFTNTDDLITRRKAVCYAFADYLCMLAGDWVDDTDNPYLTDYESSYSLLAPGISMEIHKATSADNKNMVYYLGYADLARADVDVMANYHDRYVKIGDWGMSRVLDQANAAAEKYHANPESEHYIENFAPVIAVNGAGFDMGTGEPGGLLVMHGEEIHAPNGNGFFGITKSGKAVIGTTAEYNSTYKNQLAEGIAGFGTMLVVDGELYSGIPTTNYYSDRASRTAVGITATGRVVFMVLDGRQEPWSCGGSMIEIAQIMKLAGCVTAVNLDGGGSTTFVARQAGDEELSLINRPSDGVQRSVSTSLMMVSTAPSSKTFDRALVEANYNYMTVGAEVNVTSTGLSATNNIVALPEGATWAVSDPEMAEIVDTGDVVIDEDDPTVMKKTAKVIAKKSGDFEVYLMQGDIIIGQKTLSVIVPDQIYFTREKIDGIYGQGVELPLKARYAGKEAAFVPEDVTFTLSNAEVGEMDGLTFNVVEESTIKTVTVTAALVANEKVTASIIVVLYKDGENNFNFDTATGGNRELAWLREVTNAKQEGTSTYYIIDPAKDMVTNYTVALDMSQIPIPEKLEDLTYMLPGSDMEGASAWTFLLQLAERISELTTVTAEFQIDPNFTLIGYDAETGEYDATGLTLINEYFVLNKEAPVVYDPTENTLTLKLNWKGFSQAIDPATANPMCIVNGLKLVPKADAAWDDKDRLNAVHTAEVGYKVYMRANALHTFASKSENQETFGLYPYGPYTNSRGIVENGGWFASTYATFKDSYTLIKSLKNGWVVEEGGFRYYVNGQYLKGVHLISDDGLYYQFDENGINIGQTPYTGKHVMDDKHYYMQNGVPKTGWITLEDGNWYLFDWSTGAGIHGSHTEAFKHDLEDGTTVTNNVVYEFENGRLLDGVWYHDGIGWRYYYGPYYYKQGWRELTTREGQKNDTGEKAMYFFEAYYAQQNVSPVQEAHAIVEYWYEFTDDGAKVGNAPTGLYWWDDDWYMGEKGTIEPELYFVDENHPDGNGYSLAVTDGLHEIDGNYYFFDLWTGKAKRNTTYYIHEENAHDLLPEGTYRFLEDGRIDMTTGVFNENGTLYYYYNGKRTANAGIVKYEGELYGVGNGAICFVSTSAWIANDNKLAAGAGTYRFDENGHLIASKAVVDEGGTLYYYNDSGKRVANAGLVEYGGDIYYIGEYTLDGTKYNENTAIAAVNVEINVPKSKTHDLLDAGTYRFDENGKAILTTELVEGDDGKLYYYLNGALQKGAGMIKYNEDYYYIDANGAAITDTEMLIEKPINPFPVDTYEFGADGKMIIHEGIYEGYYYVGGIKTAAGLVEEDGKYYYAAEGGKIVTDTKYDVQKTNDKLPAGIYRIGEDGALNMATELADEDGTLVYYKEGKLAVNEGLIQIDGDYYYIVENGIALVNAKQKVTDTKDYELVAGTYRFGEDGKAILTTDLVKEADGELYYYENGRMADRPKLIQFQGDYYWVEMNGFVRRNEKLSLNADEMLPAGIYRIGDDGKIILTTELVNENGHLTYYKEGILTKDAGLIKLNGAYYYINDSGYAVVDGKYNVIKHNNLKDAGIYRFAEDGKMILTTEVALESDGEYYYYVDGKLTKDAGLIKYEDAYYYITADGTALTDAKADVTEGEQLDAGTYRFGEDAKAILTTEVVKESDNKYYYYEEGKLGKDAGLVAYSNAYYYITEDGTAVTDTEMEVEKTNGLLPAGTYRFDEEGKAVLTTELVEGEDGKLYYYINGVLGEDAGLIAYEGAYYYITEDGTAVTDTKMWVEKTNDHFIADTYEFGVDGKMVIREGIYEGYYYVSGVKTAAGLIKVDEDYYYAAEGGKLVTDAKYDVVKTNDLKPAGIYRFDETGKMIQTTEIVEEDGKYYYYEDGKLGEGAGLVKVGEDYYYITEDGTAVTDAKVDVEENELVDAGTYRFDETGKMIQTTEIVEEDGKYYYYEDGKLGEGAGLVKVGEDYYYITEDGTAVTDAKVDVEENELVDAGTYRFDETGKMIQTTEIVEEDGKYYYYEEGKLGEGAGLVKVGEDYYYITEDGTAVTDAKVDVEENELVDAGTYRFDETGKMIQTTEIVEEDGKYYYYEEGKLGEGAGLVKVGEDYYYYITEDGTAVTDAKVDVEENELVDAGTYRFDETGKMIQTTEIVEEDGKYYYYEEGKLGEDAGLIKYEDNYYYITENGTAVTDTEMLVEKTNDLFPADTYEFGADGKMVIREGIYEGYYYVGGVKTAAGLVKVGEDYYYAAEGGKLVTDAKYDVVKTNDLKPAGIYRFDENGKMIQTTEIVEEDGKYYYYEDGKLTEDAGLVKVGEDYYYISENGTAVTDAKIDVVKTNNLKDAGIYRFDENGKMIVTTEVAKESDGKYYYYEDGKLTEDAGLVKVGEDYYYIGEGGTAVTDAKIDVAEGELLDAGTYRFGEDAKAILTTEVVKESDNKYYYYEEGKLGKDAGLVAYNNAYYYITEDGTAVTDTEMEVEKNNGLLPVGTYRFDEEGKAVLTTELVEGDDGKLYYYVNGALAEDAGLIEYEGAYYYITADGTAVTDTEMLVEKTNNHFPVDTYEFGVDGKMVIREGIYEGYYYVSGVKTAAGLIKVDEDYYYAAEGGKLVTDAKYDVVKTNDLKPAGTYRFDETGKMIQTTEIVEEDGKYYYYEEGKLGEGAGLVKVGEDYYYITEDGTAVTDAKVDVEENELVDAGTYRFDETGKMIQTTEIVEEDGKYYYYEEGKLGEGAGLVKVGEDYYYITEDGTAMTDAKVDVEENELVDAGTYRFDETGKMINTTELVEEDGKLTYYENGKLGKDAGLIKYEDDYYYIGEDGTAVTNTQMLVEKTNGLLPEDTYCFGDDGKMFERLAGDADENGVVDLDDVTLIFEYCTDATIKINLINANVNGDTVVDAKDALLLMQYDAGWDVELQ